jgi:hypothetical protein
MIVVTVRRERDISSAIQRDDFPRLWCFDDLSLLRLTGGDGTADRVHRGDVAIKPADQLVVTVAQIIVLVDQRVVLGDELAVRPIAVVVDRQAERRGKAFQVFVSFRDVLLHALDKRTLFVDLGLQLLDAFVLEP